MRQAPDYRVTRLALAPAAATPPILTNDAACQHCVVWLNALAGYFQAQVIQVRERAQVGAIKGSIGHVEVFRMDGVGISIIERPRPLHNHDTPNPTHHTYTLKCEEPFYATGPTNDTHEYTTVRAIESSEAQNESYFTIRILLTEQDDHSFIMRNIEWIDPEHT